jgi:hypothetical protein
MSWELERETLSMLSGSEVLNARKDELRASRHALKKGLNALASERN